MVKSRASAPAPCLFRRIRKDDPGVSDAFAHALLALWCVWRDLGLDEYLLGASSKAPEEQRVPEPHACAVATIPARTAPANQRGFVRQFQAQAPAICPEQIDLYFLAFSLPCAYNPYRSSPWATESIK